MMKVALGAVLVVALVASGALAADGPTHWGYNEADHGPSSWPGLFAECAGLSQSPIDLSLTDKESVVYDETLTADLDLLVSNPEENYYIVNNGHTVYVDTMSSFTRLTGLQLGAAYRVVGPHFHWGGEDGRGSEHTLDGRAYPLEMHIVTFNEEKYGTVKEAVMSGVPGALAVVGVFFEVSEEDNPALAPFVENLANVQKPDSAYKHEMKPFSLTALLPAETGHYFRYSGSLTTPTCNEVVTWTVMLHTQTVSKAQLAAFRSAEFGVDESGAPVPMQDNYRPVLPLNGRTVRRSFLHEPVQKPGPAYKPAAGEKQPKAAAGGDGMDNGAGGTIATAVTTLAVTVIAAVVL